MIAGQQKAKDSSCHTPRTKAAKPSQPLQLTLHPRGVMHRCEFCKILLSYAKVYKIIQIFASICRRGDRYQRGHRPRWQDGRGSRSLVPEHFEAFRNKPLPLVAFCCGLTGRLALSCELKRASILPGGSRIPTTGGRAKQKSPPVISMAARCAHAGPTSRRSRQSRLPDRKAARRRRGLDGRRAVVSRI